MFASKITGTGSYFPPNLVTNNDLARDLATRNIETSDSWIRERTGIETRHISRPLKDDETNSALGLRAAQAALEAAGKKPEDIDQIIYATCTPDTLIPSTACWLQMRLGATKAYAFDVNAACSGFVFGLTVADQFIRSGTVKNSLIIGGEVLTALTNWTDRSSCVLFGDGAGAVVLEQVEENCPNRILSSHLHSDGSLWDHFHIPAGGTKLPSTPALLETHQDKMQMKGREIFKIATRKLSEFAQEALNAHRLTIADLDWFIPHQANLRIIEAVAKRLNFPMEKVLTNIHTYGNTSSATVPTMFDEAVRSGKIKRGHLVLMDVFGAGLTYGSLLMRY